MVALHDVALEVGEGPHGAVELDTFGDYAGAERVSKVDDPGDHEWFAPLGELLDEGSVDLQLLELNGVDAAQ